MRRPQFTLKTLLWSMVVVAAFFAGMQLEWQILARRGLYHVIVSDEHPEDEWTAPLDFPRDGEFGKYHVVEPKEDDA